MIQCRPAGPRIESRDLADEARRSTADEIQCVGDRDSYVEIRERLAGISASQRLLAVQSIGIDRGPVESGGDAGNSEGKAVAAEQLTTLGE